MSGIFQRKLHMKAKPFIDYSYWDWFIHALAHFSAFSGRVPRKAFWGFHLFACLICLAIAFAGMLTIGERTNTILALYQGALFLPALALLFRRLHDTGRSGWYSIPLFVMAACTIWLQTRGDITLASGISIISVVSFFAALSWLYILIIGGFFKGQQGYNPYGIPPYERFHKEKPDEPALGEA